MNQNTNTTCEKFLADNKGKEGVVTTPSGLQYKIITKGTGEIPADTSKVKVNYKQSSSSIGQPRTDSTAPPI